MRKMPRAVEPAAETGTPREGSTPVVIRHVGTSQLLLERAESSSDDREQQPQYEHDWNDALEHRTNRGLVPRERGQGRVQRTEQSCDDDDNDDDGHKNERPLTGINTDHRCLVVAKNASLGVELRLGFE